MADDVDIVEKLWPQLAALHRTLTSLPSTVVVTATPEPSMSPAAPTSGDLVEQLRNRRDFDEVVASALARHDRHNRTKPRR